MNAITLAVVQMTTATLQPETNVGTMLDFLARAADAGADLVLFPECSLTGYTTERAAEAALPLDNPHRASLEAAADRLGVAVCYGFIEAAGSRPQITQVLFDRGQNVLYRKTHLGSREDEVFLAGAEFPVADLSCGVRCGMQLCWESHIPEISTALRAAGAELLLIPYASGMAGARCRENWNIHLPARASDNGVFAAACNALRERGTGELAGGGMAVYDPKGREIAGYFGADAHMLLVELGGPLPREIPPGDMHSISYFDRCRRELFS